MIVISNLRFFLLKWSNNMRIPTFITVLVLLVLFVTDSAFSQPRGNSGLTVGSPAPGLNIVEWVKGEFNPSDAEVYVLEFWATWCAPCRKSIPHLTELQEEYELDGLKIVGISIDQEADLVAPFVQRQGLRMDYIVGIDNRKRTERAWMGAAGIKGYPAIFIVDKNNVIQFIGRPNEEFEDILSKVMKGRYDKKKEAEAKPSIDAAIHFRTLNSWSDSRKAYENAIAIDPIVFAELNIELFEMYLLEKRDTAAAYILANKIIKDRGPEDPELLTWFAAFIATDDRLSDNTRRMDVAMNAAQTALTFAKRKTDPAYLSTIALVHFSNGDIDEAIKWQRNAYFSAREKDKQKYKFTLDSYQMKKQHASTG